MIVSGASSMDTIIIGVDESRAVLYFESLKHAQRYIEPSDIKLWRLYGADGQIIRLTRVSVLRAANERGSREVVKLVPTEQFDIESLRCALMEHVAVLDGMGRLDKSVDSLKEASLDALISLLISTSTPK